MRSNATVAGRVAGVIAIDGRPPRTLALVGAAERPPLPPRPHLMGAIGIVMALGAVVTVAGVLTALLPGLLPTLLLN